jgi:hypothetical protein
MKILVVGGMHGNEPLGIELVKALRNKPINNVDAVFANERAIQQNVRFVDQDLNRTFPGSVNGKTYEQRRAAWLIEKAKHYDIVLDFHNTYCSGNDCCFIGEQAKPILTQTAGFLDLRRVIVANYDCLNKYAKNCISIEISLDSPINSTELWYDRVRLLAQLQQFTTEGVIEKYLFTYRMSLQDRDTYKLKKANLKAFQAIDPALANKLGVRSPAYPIFIGDRFTPYNYGGILEKI